MEMVRVVNDAARFDEVVHGGPLEGGDLEFVLEQGATQEGNAMVCVTFSVELGDGGLGRVQAVTTLKALIATIKTLEAAEEGNRLRN